MSAQSPAVPGTGARWVVPVVALGIFLLWLASVELAQAARPSAELHTVALFVHLAALVAGFGAVLVIDWIGLLWALGRRTFFDVTHTADAVHVVIWGSLLALVASGIFLEPDTATVLTRIKLALVLVIALNGLHAHALQPQLVPHRDTPPSPGLLARAGVTAALSQLCWWAAMIIGFCNTQT